MRKQPKPRDIRKCLCHYCGIALQVCYDVANDDYICLDCLILEEEEEEEEITSKEYDALEETKEEQHIRRNR